MSDEHGHERGHGDPSPSPGPGTPAGPGPGPGAGIGQDRGDEGGSSHDHDVELGSSHDHDPGVGSGGESGIGQDRDDEGGSGHGDEVEPGSGGDHDPNLGAGSGLGEVQDHEPGHGHGHGHGQGVGAPSTMGGHGMLVFGEQPLYFSHLPMFGPPHNFQVLLEVRLDEAASATLAADRAGAPDGTYTFSPVHFPIADLAPEDDRPPLTTIEGVLFQGHFERGGIPIADPVTVEVVEVVVFEELDIKAAASQDAVLEYLCFGPPGGLHLVHRITARPSFDQVLRARFVPGTVTNQAGRVLDDDVATIGYRVAQPLQVERRDRPEERLLPGDVVEVLLPMTVSPSGAHGYHVQVEVERELYLEVTELT